MKVNCTPFAAYQRSPDVLLVSIRPRAATTGASVQRKVHRIDELSPSGHLELTDRPPRPSSPAMEHSRQCMSAVVPASRRCQQQGHQDLSGSVPAT